MNNVFPDIERGELERQISRLHQELEALHKELEYYKRKGLKDE